MIVVIALLFWLGAAIGSFLNVLVSRTVEGTDWVRGRSVCDYCKKTLTWYDNIPLLSFVLYHGKSRCCNKKLSWQHPIVEFLAGILFVWWYLMGNVFFQLLSSPMRTLQAGYWLVIGIILLIIIVADWIYGLVLVVPIYVAIAASLIYRVALYMNGPLSGRDFVMYVTSAIVITLFFALLHYGTKGRGMGMGDVYVAPLYGLILGWPRALVALVLSFWIGAVVGIVAIILGKKKMRQTLPFAPFMVIGILIALLWGNQLWGFIY
ncbi:MAG: prepilin peptidase [bacterium]